MNPPPITPAGEREPVRFSFTRITYPGQLMGKEYVSGDDGRTTSRTDGSGHTGNFQVLTLQSMAELSGALDALTLEQIIIQGVPKVGAREGYIHSGHTPPAYMDPVSDVILGRRKEDFVDPAGTSLLVVDSDFDHAPDWTQFIQTPQQYHDFLTAILPELVGKSLLIRPSGSNGVLNPDGSPYKPTKNFHAYLTCPGTERAG
jgi:hypothetical protein